jgi:hypothetical protein
MTEPIRDVETAVRELGALPVPVGAETPMTPKAARVRLAQYGERTKTWSTATYNSGTERALHEIALTLLAEAEAAAELRTELEQRTTLLREVQATARRRAAEAEGRKTYGDRLAAENERLRARLAEYERPADEDPIAFALTEQAVSVELPPATVRCGCGHPGSEHHHVGAKCWARLPRDLGQPVRICPCAAFAPVSVDESADRLARYMAPTEGAE